MTAPDDELRFPEHLITSVKRSQFHVIENRDISDPGDLDHLLLLLFNHPERSFYVFMQKHASLTEPLRTSIDTGDILVTQTDFEFYRHPNFDKDFIRIRRDAENFDWQRDVTASAIEYLRFTINLSEQKRRAMSIDQHLQTQSQRSSSPLKLEPNIWGIGIDLRKAWEWLKTTLRSK